MTDIVKSNPTLIDLYAHRSEILRLAEQYGAYNVRVFGSVARGEASPESDIDFVVQFQDWASLYELSGLRQDLQDLLGWKIDLVSEHSRMKERLKTYILRDAISI